MQSWAFLMGGFHHPQSVSHLITIEFPPRSQTAWYWQDEQHDASAMRLPPSTVPPHRTHPEPALRSRGVLLAGLLRRSTVATSGRRLGIVHQWDPFPDAIRSRRWSACADLSDAQ